MRHHVPRLLAVILFAFLLVPTMAVAAAAPYVVGNHQLTILIIGGLTPLAGYVINHVAPWADEKIKGIMMLVYTAIATALTQAVDGGTFGWNYTTRALVVTAIMGAFGAHKWIWQPSGISAHLGGGSNA